MKQRTKKQIEEFINETWDDVENVDVSVGPDRVDITLSNMYSAPGLGFSRLKKLSEFFETENIDDEDQFSSRGCESCDYGSRYGFTLTVKP